MCAFTCMYVLWFRIALQNTHTCTRYIRYCWHTAELEKFIARVYERDRGKISARATETESDIVDSKRIEWTHTYLHTKYIVFHVYFLECVIVPFRLLLWSFGRPSLSLTSSHLCFILYVFSSSSSFSFAWLFFFVLPFRLHYLCHFRASLSDAQNAHSSFFPLNKTVCMSLSAKYNMKWN